MALDTDEMSSTAGSQGWRLFRSVAGTGGVDECLDACFHSVCGRGVF